MVGGEQKQLYKNMEQVTMAPRETISERNTDMAELGKRVTGSFVPENLSACTRIGKKWN